MRRLVLSVLALAALSAPALSSGCAASFESVSKIDALRVFSVVADKPYAKPGDTIDFKMDYFDGKVDPANPGAPPRPIQITWLGGCFDPVGDEYYGCYDSLSQLYQQILSGMIPPGGFIAQGVGLDQFSITLPKDIVTRRPRPPSGPAYGVAYVFFAACAGKIQFVPPEGTGRAGSFPLGCFDDAGNRLGADSFVPGYTQVYVFEDGRTNANPVLQGFTMNGSVISDDPKDEPTVTRCPIDDETRNQPPSCSKPDPLADCVTYTFDVLVPPDVGEIDPESLGPNGETLREAVWVDYYASKGTFGSELKLASDPLTGVTDDHTTTWVAPADPGIVDIWIVLHDARGGASVTSRTLHVQ